MARFGVGDKVQCWHIVEYANTYRQHDITELIGGVVTFVYENGYLVQWEKRFNHEGASTFEFDSWLSTRDDWDTPEEEYEKRHNPKTKHVTSIVLYSNPAIAIDIDRGEKRRTYGISRNVDRLLVVLNSDNYERIIGRGRVSNAMQINVHRKEL